MIWIAVNNRLYRIRVLIFFILMVGSYKVNAQLDSERMAWNRLKDGKWERAHRLLKKSLRKDSSNLEANYVLAHWFFAAANPEFQIDSAHRYVNKSIRNYDSLTVREQERVSKFPIDSLALLRLLSKIDSAGFERAKKENTETGYIRFITSFPTARQINGAIELRDEVGFLDALKENTYQSFHSYLSRYPQSHRAGDASERYEKLLFEDKTKNKRLAGFKSFLKEYPKSPYADEAQNQIFEIATASGEVEDFLAYLHEYPSASNQKRVRDLLFHIYREREEAIPKTILSDSLNHVINLNSHFWIPFLKNSLFGFMDQLGVEVLSPQFQDVRDDYKCGPVHDDILSLPDGYFSRSGKKIAGATTELQSIGFGFLTLSEGNCIQLLHKSGRRIITDCHDEYKVIDGNFIAARRNGYVMLYTLAGRQLPITGITQVDEAEGLVLLTRSGKKIINTSAQLAAMVDGNQFHDELVFDEVLVVDKGLLLVRNSGLEGILNTNLEYVVPLGRQTLTKTPFGFIENQHGVIMVHGLSADLEGKQYRDIKFFRHWLVLVDQNNVQLFDIPSRRQIEADADSVWFDQSLTFVSKNNVQKVYVSATNSVELQADSKIQFIASRDSVQFFFTESKQKRTVFTLNKGEKLFSTEFELVESIGTDFFMVSRGGKKGIVKRNGKTVVPVEMNEIILTDRNHLSLLKDKKFGLYDLRSQKYVKPAYERNLLPLDSKNLIVFKDGFYGLMGLDEKPVTAFDFSEVQAWGDSLIWVKRNFQWQLLNYLSHEVLTDRVRDFIWIKNTGEEKIARFHRENYYGIISNRKGMIIPASFNEIFNLGTVDQPFYFTQKQVEEAGIFVVVYFDRNGKLVRKHAYEEDDYERIRCEDL
ncbi:MAG: hypothetical protein RI909_1594 [Bacteroidota bacterium]